MSDDLVLPRAESRIAGVFLGLGSIAPVAAVVWMHAWPVFCCDIPWNFLVSPRLLLLEAAVLAASVLLADSARSMFTARRMAPSIRFLSWIGAFVVVVQLAGKLASSLG